MPEQISLGMLEKNLAFFNKMYDVVRIVDPVQKRILEYRDRTIGKTSEICYGYWKNGKICDNCISVRAYHDNISYMKLEQNPDLIMLVTAFPVEAAEGPVILELLKNVTDSMIIGSGNYNSGRTMRNVLYDINNMVIKDHLTGVYNRRFVDERLPVDIIRATVVQQLLSVIFIDIDNMKAINDTYGHTAGDLALKYTTAAMLNCVRPNTDWIARYGGDEFVICLNNTGNDEAHHIVERLRSSIEAIKIPMQNGNITVTASLGVQTMLEPVTAEEMIRMSDEKMYEAKRSGKNRSMKVVLDAENI